MHGEGVHLRGGPQALPGLVPHGEILALPRRIFHAFTHHFHLLFQDIFWSVYIGKLLHLLPCESGCYGVVRFR